MAAGFALIAIASALVGGLAALPYGSAFAGWFGLCCGFLAPIALIALKLVSCRLGGEISGIAMHGGGENCEF
jgi:hypothetical protein